ncbi:N4-gp56 family major capsid protein [Desulfospira joergensenii]|uniref:N4-gp56 family major capsid protein n=1 Tax=Desulfospira joergensenii TaxID=53329 RepID=UPI0003B56A7D|nr:N4-gp56 family major capsid protein [Desulfospira joergensenii]
MGFTDFPLNSDLARQVWEPGLAIEAEDQQYFKKFMGKGKNAIIKVATDLKKSSAGESITVGLQMKLSGDGIEGDNDIEGTDAEEGLSHYADKVYIDQRRKGTKSKGKMSEQRVPYNLRKMGRDALAIWYGEDYDQQYFMYLAGARGVNPNFHFATDWTGRANNGMIAPSYQVYGDASGVPASSKADLDAADLMTLNTIERCLAMAETTSPLIRPISKGDSGKYVLVMHTFQAFALRASMSTNDWLDIHKHTDGPKSMIYKDCLGEWNGIILHKHRNVIRFDDYGAGADVDAARALFLGAHAGLAAWGKNGEYGRYSWNEETDDRGNRLVITAGSIYGIKKGTFNAKDVGVIGVDTACIDPNA